MRVIPRPVGRGAALVAALAAIAVTLPACRLRDNERQTPLPPDVNPEQVIDADDPVDSVTALRPEDLAASGRMIMADRKRRANERLAALRARGAAAPPHKRYNILCLSGGGIYGAYSAGVIVGWTQCPLPPGYGGRPEFDVVTGISTGALIAPLAFLGPEFDCAIKTEYTTVTNDDIYKRRRSIRGLFAESIVDNAPFRGRVAKYITPENMARLAAEHDKGRRLFVGTTNVDTKRITLWDVGGIAKKGTPEAAKLIVDVIVASASIPAFFPPVEIDVTIDGQPYQELHVDGGVTRSIFFRPPHFDPSQRDQVGPDTLSDSNLYLIIAGKIDPAPEAVERKTLRLALEGSSLLLYSLTRGDLYRMFTYCLLTGMNYRLAAIPDDLPVPTSATEFDPVEMTKMFNAGFCLGRIGDVTKRVPVALPDGAQVDFEETAEGTAWRDVPPGLKDGEKQGARTGTRLTVRQREAGQETSTRGEELGKGAILPPVVPKK